MPQTTNKQVTVDNGKGQGAYGLGESWERAACNARENWRENFGTQKPTRIRLSEKFYSDGTWGDWRTVIKEAPFTSWGKLAEVPERDR
jgi:hypothetical protein